MRTSDQTGELVKALAAAKKSIKAPKKTRTGKVSGTSKKSGKEYEYTYQYADRADVIEAYSAALAEHGLAIVHATSLVDGHLMLTSRLAHESGQWIESDLPIPAETARDAQVLGGFQTYFMRYQSCGLVDLAAEEDDDGRRASVPSRREEPSAPADPSTLPFFDLRVAIRDAAEELAQKGGSGVGFPDDIIKAASGFDGDRGRAEFSDPFDPKIKSQKWLKSTLSKLTKQLTLDEPGAAEAADLFTKEAP